MSHALDPLLRPESVAIIGASDTKARIGGRPIMYMQEQGYQGAIYPVNPSRATVQGLKAYASIADVPEAVDCAIVAVPAKIAVQAVEQCAASKVKSIVMFTSGFAEVGEQGADAQAQIGRIARESGMRIVGPNCLGVFNLRHKWFGTFANAPAGIRVPGGSAGIISQSGAYGSHVFLASQLRGVGSNYWVTTGNECDIHVAEVIEYYAQADEVSVILAYVEGVKDGDRMRRALQAARDAKKPVIFLKVGNSDVGAKAAASHTASVVGSDDIYDALFRQYGVHRAKTTQELVDLAYACQTGFIPGGRKVCLQTISGGAGIQMADVATEQGLDVPALPAAMQQQLKEWIPAAGVRNPVDFTANALNNPDLMEKNIMLTLSQGGFDSHVVYMTSVPASPFTRAACIEIFTKVRREFAQAPIVMSMLVPDEVAADYEALKLPCFADPAIAVQMLGAMTRLGEQFERRPESLPELPAGALRSPAQAVSEHEAKQVLASAGIPVARESLVHSEQEAVAAWQAIAGPVVMKIASADITHKTEIGGVLLNINDAQAVAQGYQTLLLRARDARPNARLDGILVGEMVSGGVEVVMGVVRDPVFGPAVMFGLGGIFVEVLRDVSFRLAPFSVPEAHRMINEIKGKAVLEGVRGAPRCDIDAVARTLSQLSVFAAANADRIDSIDINPCLVRPDGVFAVDALIVPTSE